MHNNNSKYDYYADIWADARVFERVENGAKWLDQVKPNWFQLINIEELDISLGDQCICGQVFMEEVESHWREVDQFGDSDYDFCHGYDFAREIHMNDDYNKASELGFNIAESYTRCDRILDRLNDIPGVYWEPIEYELLAQEWILQIEKRQVFASALDSEYNK